MRVGGGDRKKRMRPLPPTFFHPPSPLFPTLASPDTRLNKAPTSSPTASVEQRTASAPSWGEKEWGKRGGG